MLGQLLAEEKKKEEEQKIVDKDRAARESAML